MSEIQGGDINNMSTLIDQDNKLRDGTEKFVSEIDIQGGTSGDGTQGNLVKSNV